MTEGATPHWSWHFLVPVCAVSCLHEYNRCVTSHLIVEDQKQYLGTNGREGQLSLSEEIQRSPPPLDPVQITLWHQSTYRVLSQNPPVTKMEVGPQVLRKWEPHWLAGASFDLDGTACLEIIQLIYNIIYYNIGMGTCQIICHMIHFFLGQKQPILLSTEGALCGEEYVSKCWRQDQKERVVREEEKIPTRILPGTDRSGVPSDLFRFRSFILNVWFSIDLTGKRLFHQEVDEQFLPCPNTS